MSTAIPEQMTKSAGAEAGVRAKNAEMLLYVVLVLAAVLPYGNTLLNGFVYDDVPQVVENPYVRSWKYVPEIFGSNVWSFQGQNGQTNFYRPLMTLTYLALYQIAGPIPFAFHLLNVVLNAVVVLLVFRLTERLFGDRWVAVAAALVFALHPVHSEVAAWVAALPDLQLAIFVLVTMLVYTREGEWGWKRYAGLGVSYALALFSKEPAMMLLPLVVVYEHFLRPGREGISFGGKVGRYGPLFFIAGGYLWLRAALLGGLAPVTHQAHFTWAEAIYSGPQLVWTYFVKLVWPIPLQAFHPFYKSTSLWEPKVLAGIFALALCAAGFAVLWKRNRMAAFAMLWFFFTLGPVLNARWMTASVVNERYLYLPSVGFCWLAALGMKRVWNAVRERGAVWRWAAIGTAGAVALAAVAVIVERNMDWRTDLSLYRHTLEVAPDAHLIRISLGTARWKAGDFRGADREWAIAAEHIPRNPIVLLNQGVSRMYRKDYEGAIGFFERAIESRPEYSPARLRMASAYMELGDFASAERACEEAIRLTPLNVSFMNCLGRVYLRTERFPEAEAILRRSIRTQVHPEAYGLLGAVLVKQGRTGEAQVSLEEAVELDPYDHASHFLLAEIYKDAGRLADAKREYERGMETNPNDAKAQEGLREVEGKMKKQ